MAEMSYTDEEVGKRVVTADGETVGIVTEVRDGVAYVDPDPGVVGTVKAKLGWEDIDEDAYPLRDDRVGAITDDEIRLRRL